MDSLHVDTHEWMHEYTLANGHDFMAVHLYSPEHPSAALKTCLSASVSVRCGHLWWLKGC